MNPVMLAKGSLDHKIFQNQTISFKLGLKISTLIINTVMIIVIMMLVIKFSSLLLLAK